MLVECNRDACGGQQGCLWRATGILVEGNQHTCGGQPGFLWRATGMLVEGSLVEGMNLCFNRFTHHEM